MKENYCIHLCASVRTHSTEDIIISMDNRFEFLKKRLLFHMHNPIVIFTDVLTCALYQNVCYVRTFCFEVDPTGNI